MKENEDHNPPTETSTTIPTNVPNESKSGFHLTIDRSDVLAILAVMVSLGAMFVSLKQTEILKEQQEIMASQKEGSVWPNIKINTSLKAGVYTMTLVNKGVGPARIKNFELKYGDNSIKTYNELWKVFDGIVEQGLGGSFSFPSNATVIVPHEEYTVFEFKYSGEIAPLDIIKLDFAPTICYQSIYDKEYGDCETFK